MSIVSISSVDPSELHLLGNNVMAQIESERPIDFDAINRSLQTWDEQLDEVGLA